MISCKKRILSLLLVLCLLGGCAPHKKVNAIETMASAAPSPSARPAATPTASPAPTAAPAQDHYFSGEDHADVLFEDMHWELYDMTLFREKAAALTAASSAEEAGALYDWLLNEYVRLRTYSELAWIEFYASGGTDTALSEACQTLDDMLTDAGDTLFSAASDALSGEAAEGFSEHLGEERTADLADYESMTDRESTLLSRETELTLQYNECADREDLSLSKKNQQLAEIFLELVRVRNELAGIYGYDTYAEYAYKYTYGRDFTPEDAATLCENIKPYARTYYRDSYYSSAFQARQRSFSGEELMDLLRTYAPRISPEAAEAQQYMESHGLYLLKSVDEVSELGFTTLLPWYNAPFLFDGLYGGSYDVTSMFHEFGHYYDAYLNPEPDPLENAGSYDVFEIHSTALEALMLTWYDEIFGDEADVARIWTLDGLVYNVVSGCIYDEFLQYAYTHPDMTVDELNGAYREIANSYGMELYSPSARYGWMDVSHNFESPFYYISYAASALASLQILELSEQDRDAALRLYNDLVRIGAYDKPYEEVLREVGLKLFTEDLDGCVAYAFNELSSLCEEYETGRRAA